MSYEYNDSYDLEELIDTLNYKISKISDLEEKLEEIEEFIQGYRKECAKIQSENVELKQELKEKEHTINTLIDDHIANQKWYKMQLAEKETRIAELEDKDWYEGTIKQLEEQNEKLLNKLADKEKEIEYLKASSDKNIDYLIEFASLIENEKDCNRMLKALDRVKQGKKYIVDKEHQDKISFVVEKLKEIKKLLEEKYAYDVEESEFAVVYEDDIVKIIDKQIKQLKEGE